MKKNANAKEQKTQKTIQSKSIKEIIPSTYPHIQEPTPITEPQDPHPEYIPQTTPSEIFEEWPNETDISILQAPLLSFEQQQQCTIFNGDKLFDFQHNIKSLINKFHNFVL